MSANDNTAVKEELLSMGFDEALIHLATAQCPVANLEDLVAYILMLSENAPMETESRTEGLKMVLVIRNDLNMSPGKVSAQCVHAALGSVKASNPLDISDWEQCGEPVICLKCEGLDEMNALSAAATAVSLCSYIVHDAGRTEVVSGSQTVLAIGPANISRINSITGHLKLY